MNQPNQPDPELADAYRAYQTRGRTAHKQALRRQIIAPLMLLFLISILLPASLTLLMQQAGFHAVAACMSVFVLVPALILLVSLYALLVVTAFGLARLYRRLGSFTRGAYQTTHRLNRGTATIAGRVAKPVMRASSRLAYWERLLQLPPRPPNDQPPA
jgi:membrane protein implicated in regulation of membrane protease activity